MAGFSKINEKPNNKFILTITSLVLCLMVFWSCIPHFVFTVFNATVYLVFYGIFVLLFLLSKPIAFQKLSLAYLWVLPAICMVNSYLRSQRLAGSLADVIVILVSLFLVVFYSSKVEDFRSGLHLLTFLGLFFSFGILLDSMLPKVYNRFIMIFPESYTELLDESSKKYVTGFSKNPGFSAGYISAAIIVMLSLIQDKKPTKTWFAKLGFLFLGLMFTEKRGQSIFLILTFVVCYLAPVTGLKKWKRYWKIIAAVLGGILVFYLFSDLFMSIPLVKRIVNSIIGFAEGQDVSTGRLKLYRWALTLYHENPSWGIGWGDYKTTVIGNATLTKKLDTHNIYLQLLCETGLVGLICFCSVFFLFWNSARKVYVEAVTQAKEYGREILPFAFFAFAYQTFFLLYGLSGNSLYDQHYQILYFISCSMTMTCRQILRGRKGTVKGISE